MERKDLKMSRIPLRIQNFGDLPNEALISAKDLFAMVKTEAVFGEMSKSELPKPILIGSVRWSGAVREYLFGEPGLRFTRQNLRIHRWQPKNLE